MQKEQIIHSQVCQTVKHQHKEVIFWTDLSGVRLPIGLALKLKKLRSGRAIPDLFFPEPRGQYHGLFIELKADDAKVFKKDGTPLSDPHLKEQEAMLQQLRKRGYRAAFGIGYTHTMQIINDYLGLKNNDR